MENYVRFIHKFKNMLHPYINCEILNKFKDDYKDIISSRRVTEEIIDINTLLRVLEKRGVLQYDNINILISMTRQVVQNDSIDLLIRDYEQYLQQNLKINHFYNCAITAIQDPSIKESGRRHSTINHEIYLQELIISRISRKIGKYWTDVCRQLNIEESVIEEIERKYINATMSFAKMFEEALNLYFSEGHLSWKTDLMQALEFSRRKDLREIVEKILASI